MLIHDQLRLAREQIGLSQDQATRTIPGLIC